MQIEAGVSLAEIEAGWRADLARWIRQRRAYLLYD
jgi:hypothetical protein